MLHAFVSHALIEGFGPHALDHGLADPFNEGLTFKVRAGQPSEH